MPRFFKSWPPLRIGRLRGKKKRLAHYLKYLGPPDWRRAEPLKHSFCSLLVGGLFPPLPPKNPPSLINFIFGSFFWWKKLKPPKAVEKILGVFKNVHVFGGPPPQTISPPRKNPRGPKNKWKEILNEWNPQIEEQVLNLCEDSPKKILWG